MSPASERATTVDITYSSVMGSDGVNDGGAHAAEPSQPQILFTPPEPPMDIDSDEEARIHIAQADVAYDDKGHGPWWQRNKCAQEFSNSIRKYTHCLGDFSKVYRVTLETVIREVDGGHSGETTNFMSQLFADYKALEEAHKKLYATVATFWHTCKGEANINAHWIGIQPLINIFVDDERIAFLQVRRAPTCLLAGCTGWPLGNARHSRLAPGAGGARPGGGQPFQIPEGLGRAARQQRQGAGYRGVVAGAPSLNRRCLGARR
jgi:hypothetical protein